MELKGIDSSRPGRCIAPSENAASLAGLDQGEQPREQRTDEIHYCAAGSVQPVGELTHRAEALSLRCFIWPALPISVKIITVRR